MASAIPACHPSLPYIGPVLPPQLHSRCEQATSSQGLTVNVTGTVKVDCSPNALTETSMLAV